MNDRLKNLADDRVARNAARSNFHANWRKLTRDLETRGIGQRVSERALQELRDLGGKTLDVAAESKGVIAATLAALILWLLRSPILAWAENLIPNRVTADSRVQARDSDFDLAPEHEVSGD